MFILETRSKVKVTVIPKWNRDTTPFQDALKHNVWDSYPKKKRYDPGMIILKTRSEVKFKVTVTCK